MGKMTNGNSHSPDQRSKGGVFSGDGNTAAGKISFREFLIPALLLMTLLAVIYGNSFQGPFQFDDFINIVDNPNVHPRDLSPRELGKALHGRDPRLQGIQRPVANLTLALNYLFGREETFGYHLVNFAIHGLAAVMLFLLLFRILRLPFAARAWTRSEAISISLLSAALWGAHPIQVTAVTYVVQRMAALAGLFTILSMYAFIEARTAQGRSTRVWGSILCAGFGLLAVGSKENAAMLPVTLAVMDLLLLGSGKEGDRRKLKWLAAAGLTVFAIGLLFADIRGILAGYEIRPFTMAQRLMTEPRVLLFYISQLLYPVTDRFALLHDIDVSRGLLSPWTTLPALIVFFLMPVAAFLIRHRSPLVAFCVLFFWLNHLIEGSFLALELIFEHRNYLPSMFFFVPFAVGFHLLLRKHPGRHPLVLSAFALSTAFLFAQGHTVFLRNEKFSHSILLWQDNVRKAPALQRPHHNLGNAYLAFGFPELGVKELHNALQSKDSGRKDQKFKTHYNLGAYYLYENQARLAAAHFRSSLVFYPNDSRSLYGLACALLAQGELDAAEKSAIAALRSAPYRAETLLTLGWIRLKKGKTEEGLGLAAAAIRADPGNRLPFFALGEAFRVKGDLSRALLYFRLYSRSFPEDMSALAAQIEIEAGLGLEARLNHTVWKLLEKTDGRLSGVLRDYDRIYNCMDSSRIDRIRSAIAKVVSRELIETHTLPDAVRTEP